jgi:hypothetical protein
MSILKIPWPPITNIKGVFILNHQKTTTILWGGGVGGGAVWPHLCLLVAMLKVP